MSNEQEDKVREYAEKIAHEHLDNDDPVGWFDELYKHAAGDHEQVPWADMEPNPFFIRWIEDRGLEARGRKALVVGCGLGDEAKYLAGRGFDVTAFDISERAIEWAKRVHKDLDIEFHVADVHNPPAKWSRAFDFVLEIYTVQALPLELRERTIDSIADFVAPGGELVVVQRHRENDEEADELPWRVSPADLLRFDENGLRPVSRDEYYGEEEEPVKRFVVVYTREK